MASQSRRWRCSRRPSEPDGYRKQLLDARGPRLPRRLGDGRLPPPSVFHQEVIPDNKALVAGISMGLAGGLGGMAVIFIGRLSDVWGLSQAIHVLSALPIVAGLLGLFIRKKVKEKALP